MSINPIPEGFHAITPYLFAQGASRLIEFISAAFEGELIFQQKRPDGAIMHATMRIGDSMLMLADPTPEFGPMPPQFTYMSRIATLFIIARSTPAEFLFFQ
jgi:PhnB protein